MTKHHPSSVRGPLPGGSGTTPVVAIVGRPNVGKSTLFNRMARIRLAIVHDEPGVTRDRKYVDTSAFGTPYTLVDTGGFDPEDADPMKAGIARHVRAAVKDADAVVFVTDATTGPTAADRAAVQLLRESGKPVLYAANKADNPQTDAGAYDLYSLGVDQVFPVSALHGRGMGELEAALVEILPKAPPPKAEEAEGGPLRVALVGRPNAGKSSLLNRILGEDRVLVDARPGTTRDAIDALVERGDKRYIFVDTAGIRRKSKVSKEDDAVESLSVAASIRTMERAQVVVLLCDAKEGVAEQDAKILGLAEERGRAMIVVLNKCDLLTKSEATKAEELARDKLSFLAYVPVIRASAKTGRGLADLFETVDKIQDGFNKRVTTGELNRFFEQVIETRPPPTMGGKAPRLYYVTQTQIRPPTFVAMTSVPDAIHFSYRRYVINQLREHFGFEGVPVRVVYRARRRDAKRPRP
jgi:GTP-binding protein